MKSKIKYSKKAVNDLLEIKKYILLEFDSLEYAKNIINKIIRKLGKLEIFPYIGPLLSTKLSVITSYRYLVCDSYIVFYKVDNDQILIIRILHSRMDYAQVIFGEEQKNKATN